MKILLYGENWSGTHVDCISKVLLKQNIKFKIFDFFKILNRKIGGKITNKIYRKLFYYQNEILINKLLVNEIENFKPDVLLISKGINIFPETIILFKNRSIQVINWNPDDFFNNHNTSKHLLNSLSLYDYVFSARQHLFDEYKSAGIKKPIYLEWYYIPWLHKMSEKLDNVENKITFIGTYSKRRETIINSIDRSFPIEIWGAGWGFSNVRFKKHISLKNKVLSQSDFPNIISRSLINLNILTLENRDLTNLKLFEITASFGLLLTEYNEITNGILKENCFYYNANDHVRMNEKIESIFNKNNNELICEQRQNGFNRIVQNHHSITDRVGTLIDTITK